MENIQTPAKRYMGFQHGGSWPPLPLNSTLAHLIFKLRHVLEETGLAEGVSIGLGLNKQCRKLLKASAAVEVSWEQAFPPC